MWKIKNKILEKKSLYKRVICRNVSALLVREVDMKIETIKIFCDSVLEKGDADFFTRTDAVWSYWIWFLQTHPETRAYFPLRCAYTRSTMSRMLHQYLPIREIKRRPSFKRGEQYDRDEIRKPVFTAMQYVKIKRHPSWEGMWDKVWYPIPWLGDRTLTSMGKESKLPDPRHAVIKHHQGINYEKPYDRAKNIETDLLDVMRQWSPDGPDGIVQYEQQKPKILLRRKYAELVVREPTGFKVEGGRLVVPQNE